MVENVKSSCEGILKGYEKADEDTVMKACFEDEMELENVNVEISLVEEASELQMGPEAVGCKYNTPVSLAID
ncbi:Hypothetical predicted protein [Olea europaea subsp. europaea]|uniref:Uncharacterized protein n=1 Tax=Olea europaea subsp. europaea TaxID=158383 RepID=A0A8S0RGA5_OLEEU|nr:Hypothetical predicted protein [Olea europaea subsp. europaea]